MSDPFFRVEVLPAGHGDALWIEYGTTRTRRIIIDGGPLPAYAAYEARFTRLPDGDRRVELFVITHVDTDHIEGAIRLLAAPRAKWPFTPRDIWFNGYRHLVPGEDLGGREGEFLSALIRQRASDEWNKAFGGKAVVIDEDKPLPRISLEDGMVLTLLSPNTSKLERMARDWTKNLKKWAIQPGDLDAAWAQLADAQKFHAGAELLLGAEDDLTAKLRDQLKGHDPSAANGSSIAFLGEFEGASCLFLADAHMDVVCDSIRKLIPPGKKRLKLDAVKLSHHGSKNNLTTELLELVDARHFLVSTNGNHHDHPDPEAITAVIRGASRKPTIWFNYRSSFSERWEAASKKAGAGYVTRYPKAGQEGIVVPLL